MPDLQLFHTQTLAALKEALHGIPPKIAKDVYALSFLITCEDDDPRYPLLEVSYNTQKNVRAQLPESENERDARWNFAGWLQDMICMAGGLEDEAWRDWMEASPDAYSDDEHDRSFSDEALLDSVEAKGDRLYTAFSDQCVQLALTLAQDGTLARVFGKPIPILVHDLDYSDDAIAWTEAANAPALIADWMTYLRELYDEE